MNRRPKRARPSLERLEVRDLPSSFPVVVPTPGRHGAEGPYLNPIAVRSPNQGGSNARTADSNPLAVARVRAQADQAPRWVDRSLLQSLASSLYSPVTTTTPIQVGTQVFPPGTYAVPQPTRAEVRRETFWAEFTGTYYVGPPRFSNQAAAIHIYSSGPNVASNQFLRGRAQILMFTPADPTATPTTNDPVAGQIAGVVSLYPSNVLQASSQLYLNATNLPGVASNDPKALDHGLPSHLRVLLDVGISAGMYSTATYSTTPPTQTDPTTGQAVTPVGGSGGAVAYTQGVGVLDLKYSPPRHRGPGAVQTGTVVARIQAVINLPGVTNALYAPLN